MIVSFKDERARSLFEQEAVPKGFPADLVKRAIRKLAMLDSAGSLDSLAAMPGSRLDALKGDRAGQHSMRINDQWRLCFVWDEGYVHDVEIVDYH